VTAVPVVATRVIPHGRAGYDSPNSCGKPIQNLGENESADVRLGDFRTTLSDLVPGSVDVVLTDPPYPAEFLPLWSDLGEHAAKWESGRQSTTVTANHDAAIRKVDGAITNLTAVTDCHHGRGWRRGG
jgi:hypothetical protein